MAQRRCGGFPEPCVFCGRRALGIEGQDRYLTPFAIDNQWQDILDVEGASHLKCLIDAGYGEIWHEASSAYHAMRLPELIKAPDGSWTIHAEPMWKILYLFAAEGDSVRLAYSSLAAATLTDEGVALPVTSVLGIDDGDDEGDPVLWGQLGRCRKEPLLASALLAELDIIDRLSHPAWLVGSEVRQVVRHGNAYGRQRSQTIEIDHVVVISADQYGAALELQQRTGRRKHSR